MKDKAKTREQLINQLIELREKVSKLEAKTAQLKKTNEQLVEKEERFELALKASQDGLWDWNIKDQDEDWLPQYKKILGYQDDEIEPNFEKWESMLHPDDRKYVMELMRNYLEKPRNTILEGEFRLKTKNGDYRWYSSRGQGVWDEKGRAIRMVGSTRDITDIKQLELELKATYQTLEEKVLKRTNELRAANKELKKIIAQQKQTEDELRQATNFMDNLIESSLDCIVVADISGYVTRANKFFLKLLGYQREEEVIGKHIVEFGPKENIQYKLITGEEINLNNEYFEGRKVMYNKLLKEGRVSNWQNYLITKEGKLVPIEHNVSFLYNEKGDPIATVGIARNITERKVAEKALKESQEFLEKTFRTSLEGIVVIDPQGYITMANDTFFNMLGYSEEELIGENMDLLRPEGEEHLQKTREFLDAFIGNEYAKEFELEWQRKDGTLIDVELNATLVKDKQGTFVWGVGSIRDITGRKKAEKELYDYQNQLKALTSQLTLAEEKERKRFAEYLHDEIGQYLFVSQIQLEQLKTSQASKENKEVLDSIINNIKHMIDKSRSLTFELSSPILHELGLEKALEWLVEHFYKQYNIRVGLQDDCREKILSDDIKIFLYQAVRELLTNVAKHARVKDAIVSIKKDNSNMQISVEDKGVGFNSLNADSKKDHKGFGLFRINERAGQFGGHLEIVSKPKGGTIATIIVPLSL
jgi:PAS domain S-box-containing protein